MTVARALVIRQREEALSLAQALKEKGVEPYLCPLFKPHFFSLPYIENPQGLIITSKNALRALEDQEDLKHLPLYVVGDETAKFAKNLGFETVLSASGTSKELLSLVLQKSSPNKGYLWHLSGDVIREDIVAVLQAEGLPAKRHVVYHLQEVDALPLSLINDLQQQKISHALFFSPRTTNVFISLLEKCGLETTSSFMTSLCLSQNVVKKALRLDWKKIWVSPKPTLQAMIGYFNER